MRENLAAVGRSKRVNVNKTWCKGCGICASICPKVFIIDSSGKAAAANQHLCTGCRMCESHCPDFAINMGVE
ncbi:MAG TPA: 4Fe-4S binding protein [Bacillota bacterium]|nr:4Fe-4S binding protein [Bacillota bacterium]